MTTVLAVLGAACLFAAFGLLGRHAPLRPPCGACDGACHRCVEEGTDVDS